MQPTMLESDASPFAQDAAPSSLPLLDLSWADDPAKKPLLLQQLHDALFNIGFLYIVNHRVSANTISELTSRLPALFDLPNDQKHALSKLNSPHFLGYSAFAEETTLGNKDLREQFDFATELSAVSDHRLTDHAHSRDFSNLYWLFRGPNQWPPEAILPGFRKALVESEAMLMIS